MSQNFEPDKTNSVLCFKELTNFKISNLNMLADLTIITYNIHMYKGREGRTLLQGPVTRNFQASILYSRVGRMFYIQHVVLEISINYRLSELYRL